MPRRWHYTNPRIGRYGWYIWTNQNDMRLNSEKCKEMIIDFSRNDSLTSGIQSVTIGERVLERVEHANMLGVTISNNFTWSKHVDNFVSKAGRRAYMLYQLKRAGISQTDLVTIYVSIIRPILEYACPVWSTSLPKYLSDAIKMIQKRTKINTSWFTLWRYFGISRSPKPEEETR